MRAEEHPLWEWLRRSATSYLAEAPNPRPNGSMMLRSKTRSPWNNPQNKYRCRSPFGSRLRTVEILLADSSVVAGIPVFARSYSGSPEFLRS